MIKKKLVVANGTWEDKQTGKERTKWVNIGALHEHEGKHYITLDRHINLAGLVHREGDDRVFANLFDPEPYQGNGAAKPKPQDEVAEAFDDAIPF